MLTIYLNTIRQRPDRNLLKSQRWKHNFSLYPFFQIASILKLAADFCKYRKFLKVLICSIDLCNIYAICMANAFCSCLLQVFLCGCPFKIKYCRLCNAAYRVCTCLIMSSQFVVVQRQQRQLFIMHSSTYCTIISNTVQVFGTKKIIVLQNFGLQLRHLSTSTALYS